MSQTDRALHALSQEEPEVTMAALRAIFPTLADATFVRLEDLQPTRFDTLAPPTDADWIALLADDGVIHLEFQGYRDEGFLDRLFRYHLALVLRYPQRKVRSFALWLTKAPPSQRRRRIRRNGVTVEVTHERLGNVPASLLLADPRTACFAPGADAGSMTDEALCEAVARALAAAGASWYQQLVAVTTAHTKERYEIMLRAMANQGLPPVIIQDLYYICEDVGHQKGLEMGLQQGLEKGVEKGVEKGLRQAIATVAAARGLPLTATHQRRLARCNDRAMLDTWLQRASTAATAAAIFAEPREATGASGRKAKSPRPARRP